tara:strand:+ start:245 stop:1042 length:798 start_codon:yes stop_codon:yes gene_type:complete
MPPIKTVADVKKDLLRPATSSHFEVEIVPPSDLQTYIKPKQEKLSLLCSEAELPGSSLATTEINNDFTGVTERHAYRRIFEETTNFTFYVDAADYTPIRFFEHWIEYVTNGPVDSGERKDLLNTNYFYRMRYPEGDGNGKGGYMGKMMKIIKFERDYDNLRSLEYEFVKPFPLAITSIPLSYDASNLLKCTVSMTYIRYVVNPGRGYDFPSNESSKLTNLSNILDQSLFNGKSFMLDKVGAALGNGLDKTLGMNDQLRSIQSGLA